MTPLLCPHHTTLYRRRRRKLPHWTKGQRLDWAAWVRLCCLDCAGQPLTDRHLPRDPKQETP